MAGCKTNDDDNTEDNKTITNIVLTSSTGSNTITGTGSLGLTATKTPSTATSTITWSVTPQGIVSIDGNNTSCTVTGLKNGSATITAKSNDAVGSSAIFTVTVTGINNTITFNPNGGTITIPSQTVEANTTATLQTASQLGLSRSGYTFAGWATSANGAKVYDDGSALSVTTNVTLYAVWTENSSNGDDTTLYNYPTGKRDSSGTLTLKNNANSSVYLFTSDVKPANYIGTIEGIGSITVKLDENKFYNIIAVDEASYKKNAATAMQTSTLVYYSNTQPYTTTVYPTTGTGTGTWTFNNATNYWVSIEKTDNSGEILAVVSPRAQALNVPVTFSQVDYKIVYKQELKYKGTLVSLSEISYQYQNDTAIFDSENRYHVTTDLDFSDTSSYSNVLPSVQIINNTGKSIRVYNGSIQLSNFGAIAENNDFALKAGGTAYFTGFTENTPVTSLGFRSVAWSGLMAPSATAQTGSYYDSTSSNLNNIELFKKGCVYLVTITNVGSDNSPKFKWVIEEKAAAQFYEE